MIISYGQIFCIGASVAKGKDLVAKNEFACHGAGSTKPPVCDAAKLSQCSALEGNCAGPQATRALCYE